MASISSVTATKETISQTLLEQENVVGVGVGLENIDSDSDEAALVIYVRTDLSASDSNDIRSLVSRASPDEEIPIRIEVVGEFTANMVGATPSRTSATAHPIYSKKIRPAQPGYSFGPTTSSGTGGLIVISSDRTQLYVASNCHVLNGNNDSRYYATLQPGAADGGTVGSDKIGRAYSYVPLKKTDNYLDAAMSIPDRNNLLNPDYPTIGRLPGHYETYRVGWTLFKVGRTTGPQTGRVDSVNTDLSVNYGSYGGLGTIGFKSQTVVLSSNPISLPGDSGSIWLRKSNNYACAVNYAGSIDGKRSISFPFNWFSNTFDVKVAASASAAGDVLNERGDEIEALFSMTSPPVLPGGPIILPEDK